MKAKTPQIRKTFWLFLVGMLFLCNPTVALIDPLPDFFGYFFLLLSLIPLTDLSDNLEESMQKFRFLLWVGLAEILAELLVYGYLERSKETMNSYEQSVWILTFSFVFLVLKWFYLIPAFRLLFSGLDRLSYKFESEQLCKEVRGKTQCQRLSESSRLSVVVITLFATLPEFSVLTSFEFVAGNPAFLFDWYSFIGMFRFLCFLPSFAVSILLFIRVFRFFGTVMRDKSFLNQLQTDYQNRIQSDGGVLAKRKTGLAFQLFLVGIFFLIPLPIENREILPGAVCALLFTIGFFFVREWFRYGRVIITFSALLFLVSCLKLAFLQLYLQKYVPQDAIHYPDAYNAYVPVQILAMAEAILCLGLLVCLLISLRSFLLKYTWVEYNRPEVSARASEKLHRELLQQMAPLWILAVLIAAGKFLMGLYQPEYPWLWWIPFIATIVFMFMFSDFLSILLLESQNMVFENEKE